MPFTREDSKEYISKVSPTSTEQGQFFGARAILPNLGVEHRQFCPWPLLNLGIGGRKELGCASAGPMPHGYFLVKFRGGGSELFLVITPLVFRCCETRGVYY